METPEFKPTPEDAEFIKNLDKDSETLGEPTHIHPENLDVAPEDREDIRAIDRASEGLEENSQSYHAHLNFLKMQFMDSNNKLAKADTYIEAYKILHSGQDMSIQKKGCSPGFPGLGR